MLMQQDQYKFVLCTYNTRDSQPRETLPLDDFNVDYLNDEEGIPHRSSLCRFATNILVAH